MADALDVSRQSVSKWESNSAVPELEKLIQLAQIFGVSLDELVGGECKEESASAPPPPPAPVTSCLQNKLSLSSVQILGMALLIFGAFCLITLTVVGSLIGLWVLGPCVSLPFFLISTVCLVCKKNIGLWIGWVLYLPGWLYGNFLVVRGSYIVGAGLLIAGGWLTAVAIRRIYRGQLSLQKWKKVRLFASIILALVITLFLCLTIS